MVVAMMMMMVVVAGRRHSRFVYLAASQSESLSGAHVPVRLAIRIPAR